VQFNSRIDKLERWAWQNIVSWAWVIDHFRTMNSLFDEVLARYLDDTERADFWAKMLEAAVQEAEASVNGDPR
jgi:hypothetical protein